MRNERRRGLLARATHWAPLASASLAACSRPPAGPDPAARPEARPLLEQPAGAPEAAASATAPEARRDGRADFDFYVGTWKIHNKRLRKPLTGSTDWYEFDSTSVARKIWGGKANLDEFEADSPSGRVQGVTLRLYDPASRQWRLYWANAAKGVLEAPVVGSFKDGRGEFFDQELYEGRSIFVRYVWSDITPKSARWEQAFSEDGGKTWETNWIMLSTRID